MSHEHIGKTEHYIDVGPIRLMKTTGMCPECKAENSLLMDVDEFGVHGVICRKCGYERRQALVSGGSMRDGVEDADKIRPS